jgi:hypothetical protein
MPDAVTESDASPARHSPRTLPVATVQTLASTDVASRLACATRMNSPRHRQLRGLWGSCHSTTGTTQPARNDLTRLDARSGCTQVSKPRPAAGQPQWRMSSG